MAKVKCACDPCGCEVDDSNAVKKDGKLYCSDKCANECTTDKCVCGCPCS